VTRRGFNHSLSGPEATNTHSTERQVADPRSKFIPHRGTEKNENLYLHSCQGCNNKNKIFSQYYLLVLEYQLSYTIIYTIIIIVYSFCVAVAFLAYKKF